MDAPLVAVHKNFSGGPSFKYCYLTDGNGRELAFTGEDGNDRTDRSVDCVTYSQNGGNQAGSIAASDGFENARGTAAGVESLSFYRNRYYDQQTGRFTQEDPIGIAGASICTNMRVTTRRVLPIRLGCVRSG